jgi:Transglycosylase-like domain/Putative peptidoglycan binding domain
LSTSGPDAGLRQRLKRSAIALAAMVALLAVVGVSSASAKAVVVKKGDRGPAVKRIQKKLHKDADGVFGSATKRAVKRFQRRKDLESDGVVGPATRRAMHLRPFSRASVHRGSGDEGGGASDDGNTSDDGSTSVKLPRKLRQIAECESGGNPKAISPDGTYRGKYQFSRSTWKSIGGDGDPAKASESEQDRRALKLYRKSGTASWPNCG